MGIYRRLVWVLLALLIFTTSAMARVSIYDFDVKQWMASDGLSSQSVRSIVQDKRGYIWAGTLYGLNRFDGFKFTHFKSNVYPDLVSNGINKLFVDSTGYLWIGTKNGLSGLDPLTLEFKAFNILGEVTDIVEADNGDIWVAAEGLYSIRNFEVNLSRIVRGNVNHLATSPAGLWLINEGYLRLIRDYKVIHSVLLDDTIHQALVNDLYWNKGELYISTDVGAYLLDNEDKQLELPLPEAGKIPVYRVLKDTEGGLWLSSYEALYYKAVGVDWQKIKAEDLGFPPRFADLYEDKNKNIWLGSFSDGLWRARLGKISRHVPQGVQDEAVRTLSLNSEQMLWLGTQSGLGYMIDQENFRLVVPRDEIERSSIHQMLFVGDDIYLGTENGVLAVSWKEKVNRVRKPPELDLFNRAMVRVIQPSVDGGIWIGSSVGLYKYMPGQPPEKLPGSEEFDSENINFVFDQGNRLWVGTTQGMYVIRNGVIESINQERLRRSFVTSILDFNERGVLVSTLDDGIFFRNHNGFWSQFDESRGLPDGAVFSMHFEKSSDIVWVSTIKGIYRFTLNHLEALKETAPLTVENILSPYERQLGTAQGRCCNGIGHGKIVRYRDSLWFPTLKGVVEVPIDIDPRQDIETPPIIESVVMASGGSVQVVDDKPINIKAEQRDFTILYTSIDFKAPDKTLFRYKFEGHSDAWVSQENRRAASFTNLGAGDYRFVVQARRFNQQWEDALESSVSLHVEEKLQETLYYKILILLLIIVAIVSLFNLIRKHERREQEKLAKQVKEKTRELMQKKEELERKNNELKANSHTDEVSGLRNRQFLFQQLPKDIEHFQRNREAMIEKGKTIALIVLDIDNLQVINEKFGPIAGDAVLSYFASLLNKETRGSDYVVRWGGDEFLIVFRDTYTHQIPSVLEELVKNVAKSDVVLPDGKRIRITCSVGYALFPLNLIGGQLINWDISLSLAEMALHKVKNHGRSGIATIVFDDQVDAFEFEDSDSVAALVERLLAIESSRFDIKYVIDDYDDDW